MAGDCGGNRHLLGAGGMVELEDKKRGIRGSTKNTTALTRSVKAVVHGRMGKREMISR